MKKFAATLFLVAALVSRAAVAQNWWFTPQANSLTGSYDPYMETPLASGFTVRIAGMRSGSAYPYFVTAEPSVAQRTLIGSVPGAGLAYIVADSAPEPRATVAGFVQATSIGQTIQGGFSRTDTTPATQTNEHQFAIVPLPGQILPAGTYYGTMSLALYTQSFKGTNLPRAVSVISLTYTVEEQASLGIVVPGGAWEQASSTAAMDFGELASGASRSLDLVARSNSRYSISITSRYGSRLRNDTDQDSMVPYTLVFAGSVRTLSPGVPVAVVSSAPRTLGTPARYRMDVVIGELGFTEPGEYSDHIMFTIAGN